MAESLIQAVELGISSLQAKQKPPRQRQSHAAYFIKLHDTIPVDTKIELNECSKLSFEKKTRFMK